MIQSSQPVPKGWKRVDIIVQIVVYGPMSIQTILYTRMYSTTRCIFCSVDWISQPQPLVNSCPLIELQTHKYSHEFLTIPMHFQPILGNWAMLACLFNQFCLERFRLRWSLMRHANEICWNEILGWPYLWHLTSGPQIMPNNTCRVFVSNFI